MSRTTLLLIGLVLAARGAEAQRQTREVTRVADGVYAEIYSEMKMDPVQSNSLIIIGDDGVCVVDAHYTPSAARETIATIKKLTHLPVRYVVTTHWHDDHIFGNQEYQKAFPGVQFVAQQETRSSMVARALEHQQSLAKFYEGAVPRIETRLAKNIDRDGKPLSPADRAEYQMVLPVYRDFLADIVTVKIVLPTITFDREITLHLGQREVRVMSFGPGNTKGDAVIFLPQERIAAVGDLIVYPVPFIFGGFPVSWGKVIDSVKALNPTVIMPGHGPLMHDFGYVDQVSGLLQSMASQVKDAVGKGLSLEDTRKAVDLTRYHDLLVQGDSSREGTYDASILQSGLESAYKEAKGLQDLD